MHVPVVNRVGCPWLTRTLAALGLALLSAHLFAQDAPRHQELNIRASDGTDLNLYRYPARGEYVVVWVAPGSGRRARSETFASALADNGIEVWHIDFAEALFKPGGTGLMRSLDGNYVADIIEQAHAQTGKRVILFSRSYGAIPVLRGAHRWQGRHPDGHELIGAILISPDLYTEVPALGQEPQYLPIARATSIPLFILQAQKRGNRWQLRELVEVLRTGGSPVYLKMMHGVTGLFYEGDDAPATRDWLAQLPAHFARYVRLLERHPLTAPPSLPSEVPASNRGLDTKLKPYTGDPVPPAIDLYDVQGQHYERRDYTGKVTVVNFWASWCPPCVEEIPSLNRLKELMADEPFELISINYAEDEEHIRRFLDMVNVEFPVLLDSDGAVARQWNVIAFPSTFVIGPSGRIRYGVNAAIHWDTPQVVETLKKLAQPAPGAISD